MAGIAAAVLVVGATGCQSATAPNKTRWVSGPQVKAACYRGLHSFFSGAMVLADQTYISRTTFKNGTRGQVIHGTAAVSNVPNGRMAFECNASKTGRVFWVGTPFGHRSLGSTP
jgi:hypothetical protein